MKRSSIVLAAGLGAFAVLAGGEAWPQAGGPVFTEEQAVRGAKAYSANCAACHGEDMKGGTGAPPLAGGAFAFSWKGMSVGDLLDKARTMPPGQPDSLTPAQYAEIVTAILKANGAAAGATPMAEEPEALKGVPLPP
jgi:mono/diheme cytochrome c family protein